MGKVTPSCPLLSNLLYDSPVGAQMFTFKDRCGRVVGTVDAFPEDVSLGAGKGFTCTLTVAHHDVSVLKKFEQAPLWISRSCKSDIKVAVHTSRADVAMGGAGTFKARVLRPGQRCNVFVALDTQAKLAGARGVEDRSRLVTSSLVPFRTSTSRVTARSLAGVLASFPVASR